MKFGFTFIVTIALLLASTAAFGAKQVLHIASDDSASNYAINKYDEDASAPFVFCGVNDTAGAHGSPCFTVTGMAEVPPCIQLIYSLKHFTRVVRVGYLTSISISTGCLPDWTAPLSFRGAARKADEQGAYAAAAALRISRLAMQEKFPACATIRPIVVLL
jgi:hypothetical protein